MGRHFWTKHVSNEHDRKPPGCISGLINVLAYHQWNSNTHHNRYAGQTGDWSPEVNLLPHDSCEVESLLDEKQSPLLKTKRARGNNKRSLKSRIKALIAEEIYKERESGDAQAKEGFLIKSRLQRTYSIHHLESLDDSISKISTDWKNPIIFIHGKLENSASRSVDITQTKPADSNEASGGESDIFSAANVGSLENTDFLDILKIDKELFVRNLRIADERVVRFSHDGLASNGVKFSKSRSFPGLNLSQRLKFKPSKLADKQKETWYKRRSEKDQDSVINGPSGMRKGLVDTSEETTIGRVGENTMRNYSYSRSSSVNESLDKYARLFDNNHRTDAKFNPSRSLRLTNEKGFTSMYSNWIRSRSVSNADSFYSNLNLGVAGDDDFGHDSFDLAKDNNFHKNVVEDEEKVVRLVVSNSEKEPLDLIETVECETEPVDMQRVDTDSGLNSNPTDQSSEKWEDFEEETQKQSSDFFRVPESISCSDPCSISDSHTILQEKLSSSKQLKISEDKFVKSIGHVTDSGYVRLILDQSGIAKDASERAWHASDQPLSPHVLEDVESCWPHEHDQSTSWQDFCSSCWQHQMLFDLVNETLLETYDVSLPYYPKPLSSSCHVRPFPVGDRIVEEVCKNIDKLLDLRMDERQSMDCIMLHDLKDDYRWMNLQFETECIGLELEDMILDDLVEELMCFEF